MRKLLLALSLSVAVFGTDARALFQAGSKALDAGNAAEAVKKFEAAYAVQPAPSLLFWLGEGYRARGDKAKAKDFYEQYLKAMPNGPKAATAKARLTELSTAVAPVEKQAKKSRKKKKRAPALALAPLELPGAEPRPAPQPLKLPAPAPQPADAQTMAMLPVVIDAPPKPATAPPAPPPLSAAPLSAAPPPAPVPAPAKPPVAVAQVAPMARPVPAKAHELPRNPVVSAPPATPGYTGFVQYTARILVVGGQAMQRYSTLSSTQALFTHGIAAGVQGEHFRNAVYFGFGTEIGTRDGSDTLRRYELSWQCLWTPLGPDAVIGPYLGFRAGGTAFQSQFVTGGATRGVFLLAAQGGFDLHLGHFFALNAGLGWDENIHTRVSNNQSISGYSFDLGAALRF